MDSAARMQTSAHVGNSRWGAFDGLSPLFRHRSLVWQFIVRNVELRHKGSHLGLIWSFLNPLLMLGLYVFVFGYVFGAKDPGEDPKAYALGIFVGLTLFHLVAEVFGVAPTIIVANPNFVKKVVFPLEVLPVATVGASFVHFLISMGLILLGAAFVGTGLGADIIWLPAILLPVMLLTLGLAWAVSAIGVFFRDIAQFTGFLSMALMFSSAIFYPAAMIARQSELAWSILRFNPLIHAIELARDVILRHQPVSLASLGYLYAVGLASAAAGYWVFRKLRPAFADVL